MFSIGLLRRNHYFSGHFLVRKIFTSIANLDICKPNDSKGSDKLSRPVRLVEPGKVRMGFIPEEWFQIFYKHTGVTGPYMVGIGIITFLSSKEIYVMEHEFYSGLSLAIMAAIGVKTLGPATAKYCDQQILHVEKHWQQNHKDEIKNLEKAIEREKEEQWRAQGALDLVEAKRYNIELQIEAAVREAIFNLYKEINYRLEYQVECHHVEQRVQKKHMIQWVAKHVFAGLPSMSKEAEMKAKADMSAMCLQIR